MTLERLLTLLEDLRPYCQYTVDDTTECAETDYLANRILRQAVERNLESIGEVIARLLSTEPTMAEHFSAVRRIIGLRNRLAHGYDADIDDRLIWEVTQRSIPVLPQEADVLLIRLRDDAQC